MSMLLRRHMMRQAGGGGLPAAYRQVEYLQNSSGGYIVTNYKPPLSNNIRAEFDYAITQTSSADCCLFGYSNTASSGVRFFANCYQYTRWYAASGTLYSGSILSGKGVSQNSKHHAELTSGVFTVDEDTGTFSTAATTGDALPIYIFSRNRGGSANAIAPGARLYSLRIYDGSKLEADFVPCVRISDNEPGMYDLVSMAFYANSGSGDFIIPT